MQEAIDGDLAARAFGLLQVLEGAGSQARCRERSRQRLELALLAYFQAFCKVYIGEHVMHASKVRINAACGAHQYVTSTGAQQVSNS